jgi:asparagine synthase (glutamine-hydrolysing)
MCAIAGEISLTPGGRVRLDAAGPMAAALRHRGPDQWGWWTPDDRSVALVNARLAIVDLDGGRQPLANEDGSVWVTFNGEIYGFERLMADLAARGHRFRTRTDTEVIAHLYEEYGARFTDHLRGEFALALHDVRAKTTLLVRDRFGIKPLFYARTPSALVFASEMKGLFAHPDVSPSLNRDEALHMLGGVFLPGHTLFEGVRQVEPGTMLRVTRDRVETERYWAVDLHAAEGASPMDDRDVVAEFSARLAESIRLRLHGDVEPGVYLSGGVDSAAVTRGMADTGRRIQAFTVGFAGAAYDETARATEVASSRGVEHHVVRVGPLDLADPFVASVWHAEAPVINAHAAAKFVLSGLAARHVKVVLTGEGADETLVGYDQFRHQQHLDVLRRDPGDRAARAAMRDLLRRTGTLSGTIPITRYPDEARVRRLFGCYPYPLAKSPYYQPRLRALLCAPLRARSRTLDSLAELAPLLDRAALASLPAVAQSQHVLIATELPGYVLSTLGDRMEMAHSVEGRTPFLDHPLVEYVNRLPLRFKLRHDVDKWVLREAGRDGRDAVSAPKRPFMAPSLSTLGLDRRHGPLDRYFDRALIEEAGIFNPSAIAALRLGARILPAGTRAQAVCEAATVLALSVHVLFDLYCRRLRESLERYRCPARVEAGDGAVPAVAIV